MKVNGFAALRLGDRLAPYSFDRRALRASDVGIEILYCGVCHSDLHQVRDDWGWAEFPLVPGHEIVGRVADVGAEVTQYKTGDTVAVGVMVDSCGHCRPCRLGLEQYCKEDMTPTYAGKDRIDGALTQGGYSNYIVVRDEFVLSIPEGMDPARAAPLLCAGITTWSPLREWNAGPGTRVAVVGLGGLGHVAVKLAAGLGADVTVITRSPGKAEDAAALGASHVLISSDAAAVAEAAASFDLIIDTVPVEHSLDELIPLLDVDGTLAIVGQIGAIGHTTSVPMIKGRRRVAASMIGGIAQTQEMLDFCARKGILPDCEVVAMADINEVFERLERADVRYRFVIDMQTLGAST